MNPVAKLALAGLNMGAAALVGKGLGAAWTKATGNQPPAISHDSEDTLRQVILWTVLTSVVGALSASVSPARSAVSSSKDHP